VWAKSIYTRLNPKTWIITLTHTLSRTKFKQKKLEKTKGKA